MAGQRRSIGGLDGGCLGEHLGIGVGGVEHIAARQDRAPNPRRLQRIVPADARYEAAAHHHDVGQPEEQAQFAQGVGHIDRPHRLPTASQGAAQHGGDLRAPLGMARRQNEDPARRGLAHGVGYRCVFPRMGAGRQHHLATGEGSTQAVKLGHVSWQGLAHKLEVQTGPGCPAQTVQPFFGGRVLRHDQVEGREQSSRRGRPL